MSEKAVKWCILPTLIALGASAWADATTADPPERPSPALAAASLVYSYVAAPLGSGTWAEKQLADIRSGARPETREDLGGLSSLILLALQERPTPQAYVLEMEAPSEATAPDAARVLPEPQLQGAFEAMGLTPADLIGPPDLPPEALTIAGTVIRLLDWGFERGTALRERVRGSEVMQIDPEEDDPAPKSRDRRIRYRKPDVPEDPPIRITKAVVRSVYKMLLGVAIGVLIWGVVRKT